MCWHFVWSRPCCQSTTEVKPAEEVVEREVEQQAGGGHGGNPPSWWRKLGSWMIIHTGPFLLFMSSLPMHHLFGYDMYKAQKK